MDRALGPAHPARAHAAGRDRRDLRKPAQRHRRCRRALPEGRQCGDPARRVGKLPFLARDPCLPGREGLRAAGLPEAAIQLVPDPRPRGGGAMLRMAEHIDVIVPRGGKGLVGLVQAEARVPVFAHLEGICHVYLDARRRPGQGAPRGAERQDPAHRHLRRGRMPADPPRPGGRPGRAGDHRRSGRRRGRGARRRRALRICPGVVPARRRTISGASSSTCIIAARWSTGVDGAIAHIRRYGSSHTESILTEDARRRSGSSPGSTAPS
jgi:hypothetical protein